MAMKMGISPNRSGSRDSRADTLHCAPLLSGSALDAGNARHLAATLRVLADPARLRILSLLQSQPGGQACVCHLTDHLALSQPTVSHHLRVLFEAGMVSRSRRANWVYYRTVPDSLAKLRELLGPTHPESRL